MVEVKKISTLESIDVIHLATELVDRIRLLHLSFRPLAELPFEAASPSTKPQRCLADLRCDAEG